MRKLFFLFSLFFISSVAFAANQNFEAGKDYQVIKTSAPADLKLTHPGKVLVVEFFSYGCPACYHLEPTVTTWRGKKSAQVEFERVPVVFHPEWALLAKAYSTAKALNVSSKIDPALFKAIHEDGQAFNSEQDVEAVFIQQGVKKEDFENIFEFSPGMAAQLQRSENLMNTYKIMEVPTFVVNGKYKTNIRMTRDPQRLIEVLNYLVAKERT